ncbi:MAG: LD-carboxypeptidase, partial [Lachnospiraceae bacterium]|nr:LD-carboxypeptidase [Lachnospiraceae bacterium]
PLNDAVISVGGGELMCEDLPFVDFDAVKRAPAKWYMGYSDNTNFTFLLPTLCDTAAVYGPCAGAFGMVPLHQSVNDAFALITGKRSVFQGYDLWEKEGLKSEENPLEPYNVTEESHPRFESWDGGPIFGRFIGGCLDCLVNLCGTRFDRAKDFAEKYREDGIIWFLEACDLNVFSIRRALWELKEAGWFSHVKAFLIGRPVVMGQSIMGLDQYSAVTGILSEFNVPILMDLDIGHLPPAMPIVSGGCGTVTKEGPERISIRFQL